MTDVETERQRVRALIEQAGVAILMNVNEEGTHIGRPMLPLLVQGDPHIYFLTHQSSRKVTQLAVRPPTSWRVDRRRQLLRRGGRFRPALARS